MMINNKKFSERYKDMVINVKVLIYEIEASIAIIRMNIRIHSL